MPSQLRKRDRAGHFRSKPGRDGNCCHESYRPDEGADDLGSDDLAVGDGTETEVRQTEKDKKRYRRSGVGEQQGVHRGHHVVASNSKTRPEQRAAVERRVGETKLPDRPRSE